MPSFWPKFAVAVLLVSAPLSGVGTAQSVGDTVRQVTNALSSINNLVCSEKKVLATFRGRTRLSENLYEYVAAAPRATANGQVDLRSGYVELIRINGKAAPKSDSIIPATITNGASTIFRNQRSYFDFSVSGNSAEKDTGSLVIEFQMKKGNSSTPTSVPDFGKATVDKESKQIVRLERTFLGLTQSAGPSFQNAESIIVENYGDVLVDGNPIRIVKTWTMRVTERSNRDMVRTFASEYSDCHRFDVSVTIQPVR